MMRSSGRLVEQARRRAPRGGGGRSKWSSSHQLNPKPQNPGEGVRAGPLQISPNPHVSGELCLGSHVSLWDRFGGAAQGGGFR